MFRNHLRLSIGKKICLLFINLCMLVSMHCYAQPGEKAITYALGSRLGDNILDYARAKWLAYKFNLTFLYRPFHYSDQLVLHDVEQMEMHTSSHSYQTRILWSLQELSKPVKQNTLYVLQHIPDSIEEYRYYDDTWNPQWKRAPYISVDWEDPVFKETMRQLIRPRQPINLFYPPQNIVTVALHYRCGEGYDSEYVRATQALRLPPKEFFLEQLHTLHALVGYAPMYVYLFTDHPDPLIIKQSFQEHFPGNIHFECRKRGNHHDRNVLEDMFSMMNFDCLIRSASHYSTVASHLGDHKILIYPVERVNKGAFKVKIVARAEWDQATLQWSRLNEKEIVEIKASLCYN